MIAVRTTLFSILTATLIACSGVPDDGTEGTSDDDLSTGATADRVLNEMLDQFWDAGHGEFRRSDTSYWINAQAFDAVLDGVERSHGREFSKWIAKVRDGNEREFGGFFTSSYGKTFFDDVTWMTLALLRASELSSGAAKARYLAEAEQVFQIVIDRAPSHVAGKFSGLWWTTAHDLDEKATASNFGPVIAAARLFERTKKARYESFATTVYDHWNATMVEVQPDGSAFVLDNVQNGKKAAPRFTYNQGLAIGAALAMANISKSPADQAKHLARAHAFADYLVEHETRAQVLVDFDSNDTTPSACGGDCAAFKGIAYRYLAEIYEHDTTRADYYAVLHSSAHAILANDHDDVHHRFGTRWDVGGRAAENDLAANASAVMAIQIFARLPKPPP